jgi:hypothetical protein
MGGNQIRAEFGTLDQLAADQGSHAGTVDEYRANLLAHASAALGTLDGGMGSDEHEACMRQVETLVNEHIAATYGFQRSTDGVHEQFVSGGTRARNILGSDA